MDPSWGIALGVCLVTGNQWLIRPYKGNQWFIHPEHFCFAYFLGYGYGFYVRGVRFCTVDHRHYV